jgi:hypothetical protein
MNGKAWAFARAVRGPVMLITFGTLMALNHTDKVDFERSWPVLIIVYGVFKLLERMVGRPVPPDAPPVWPPQAGNPAQSYAAAQYPPPTQYPPVYPPPQTPQGGAQ